MKLKYEIGDKVKFFKDQDFNGGEIVGFSYDSQEEEFRYTFTSRVFDAGINDMVDGVKTCLESELVEVGTDPKLDKVVKPKNE